jgi:2-keto-4-pentenoate hydratase
MVDQALVRQAAERLLHAQATRVPCAPVRELTGPDDVEAAYAVQQLVMANRLADGATVTGWKIGLTSTAVQSQLGVDRPDFGVLLDDMAVPEGHLVPIDRLLQPKVEAELAFVLSHDVDEPGTGPQDIRTHVASVAPALEIVDSRIDGWDITYGDTVADNASSGLYVIGSTAVRLSDVTPADVTMTMTRDGEPVSRGRGADCLGDPLAALHWLAVTMVRLGSPLRAGQVVLSGALGPMVAVRGGEHFAAELSGVGRVSVSFTSGRASG